MMERIVVVSDVHGQKDKFKQAKSKYGDTVHWIINGDLFDRGPDTKGLLDEVSKMDCTYLTGNHEWVYKAALSDIDSGRRSVWQEVLFGRYESNVLSSYGLKKYADKNDTCEALRYRMQELEHWAILDSTGLYYEDESLFVVHAGLRKDLAMKRTRTRLEIAQNQANSHKFTDEPEEIFSTKLARDMSAPSDLRKTLITGHAHLRWGTEQRLALPANSQTPKRVFLASYLDKGDPLYVYENWSNCLIAV